MNKGFIRIVEVLIVLMLMFTLLASLVKTTPPTTVAGQGNLILSRHAEDIKNMVCNSDGDRRRILLGAALIPINNSIEYAVAQDLKYRVAIVNVTDPTEVFDEVGYALPNLNDPDELTDVSTAGCLINGMGTTKRVLVQTWY